MEQQKNEKESKPRESALFVDVRILHKEAQLTLDLLTVTTKESLCKTR